MALTSRHCTAPLMGSGPAVLAVPSPVSPSWPLTVHPEASRHHYKYTVSWHLGFNLCSHLPCRQTAGTPGCLALGKSRLPGAPHPSTTQTSGEATWSGFQQEPILGHRCPCGFTGWAERGSGSQSKTEFSPLPQAAGQRFQKGAKHLFSASCMLFRDH